MGLLNLHLAGSSSNVDVMLSDNLFVRIYRSLMRILPLDPAGGGAEKPLPSFDRRPRPW
jgi:hypothetical protein